jgi:hypothetical protein
MPGAALRRTRGKRPAAWHWRRRHPAARRRRERKEGRVMPISNAVVTTDTLQAFAYTVATRSPFGDGRIALMNSYRKNRPTA